MHKKSRMNNKRFNSMFNVAFEKAIKSFQTANSHVHPTEEQILASWQIIRKKIEISKK